MCTTAARSAADGRISCVFDWFASSSTWMQPWLSPTNTKLWPTNTMLEGASAISQENKRVMEGMAALICSARMRGKKEKGRGRRRGQQQQRNDAHVAGKHNDAAATCQGHVLAVTRQRH